MKYSHDVKSRRRTGKKSNLSRLSVAALAGFLVLAFGTASLAQPPETGFFYQGRLERDAGLAHGYFDLVFNLYDEEGEIFAKVEHFGVEVIEGLFTVELDFGSGVFTGAERWLEIEVRGEADSLFATIEPRQRLAAAPRAPAGLDAENGESRWAVSGHGVFYDGSPVEVGTSQLKVDGTIESRSGGFKFPDGTVQTTADAGQDNLGNHVANQNIAFTGTGIGLESPSEARLRTGADGHTWFALPGDGDAHRFGVDAYGEEPGSNSAEFVVDSDGRVGINRFDPHYWLDVDGTGRFGNDSDQVLMGSDGNAFVELQGAGTPFIDFSNTIGEDFDMRLILTGDHSLTIDGGRLGLGGTMTNPQFKLDLPNNAGPDGQGRANAWTTYSSRRFKDNIATLENPMEKIRRLRGVDFDWKQEHGGGPGIGFVAEEVGEVLPELVTWEEDGNHAMALRYSGILPIVVEALKQQLAITERQQAEIEQLKAAVCTDHPEVDLCR
ncbi:MAG: tail fiber domain-containing protein [bacterium]|nr:tail fiber domain-containing protein [bacterium]